MIFVQFSQSATTKLTIQSRDCNGNQVCPQDMQWGSRKFLFGENLASLLTLHFPSLPRSHSFVFFAVHKTHRIFLGPFSCQMIVFKNRTRHRDAKCVEGKGEWGGDISPLVHQEIMRSVPTPQLGPVRRPRTKKR